MRFGKLVLSFSLMVLAMFVLSANVSAQCSCGLGQGQLVKRVVSRAVTPVVNTVSFVAQNRPRPLARLTRVALPSSYVSQYNYVLADSCGCATSVQAVRLAAVPVLETRSVVCSVDSCGTARVAPVATVLRNAATAVPRAVRNLRAVRQANFINSNLFYVPVGQAVESVSEPVLAPEPVDEVSVNNESSDLLLASI